MIVQGSNLPVVVRFNRDVSDIPALEVHMFTPDGDVLKHWSLTDVQIDRELVKAPLTQAETLAFEEGTFILEVKWLDADGKTHFTHRIRDKIVERNDTTLMGSEAESPEVQEETTPVGDD